MAGPSLPVPTSSRSHQRKPSELFIGSLFTVTVVALILAPVVAGLDLARSYWPYSLLRLWVIGFCFYGITLSGRAGGFRRVWQAMFALIAVPFVFVWGLAVEQWAVIDFLSAGSIAASAMFLRTEPPDQAAA